MSSVVERFGGAWAPGEREDVIVVVGATGAVGCSTVALALATAAVLRTTETVVRVLDCAAAGASGLVGASTAEVGSDSGWRRGTRDAVRVERVASDLDRPDLVPWPLEMDAVERAVTVVDAGWDVSRLVTASGWLGALARQADRVVVVARPTTPSLRRLEIALALLEPCEPLYAFDPRTVDVAIVGRSRRRWARGVEQSAGPRVRAALQQDLVHVIAEDRPLASAGVTIDPLPRAVIAGANALLAAVMRDDTTASDPHTDVERTFR